MRGRAPISPRILLACLVTLQACDDGGTDPIPAAFSLNLFITSCKGVNCSSGQLPITAAERGDTVVVGYLVEFDPQAENVEIMARPGCAVNFGVHRNLTQVTTLPEVPICADSLEHFRLDSLLTIPGRAFFWIIADTIAPGNYRLESETFRSPRVGGIVQLDIQ
jgi:hypothetical protein